MNETLFRYVNERILELVRGWESPVDFVCECADIACFGRISVEIDDFDELRREPAMHLLLAGHVRTEERVVGWRDDYVIVERLR